MSNKRKAECNINEKEDWYEVIDGQQRLTTIKIILSVLVTKKNFSISYETRKDSKDYLDNLNEKDEKSSVDNIDFLHIYRAKQVVEKWLKNNNDDDNNNTKNALRSVLTSQKDDKHNQYGTVQIIWYEIAENDATNPIDTFTRLNIGKIPLTNAELVKALFLRKGNFSESADRWQIEIASEWDNMEYKLQDDAFWYFLTNGKTEKTTRIEFLFDVMCKIEKNKNKDLVNNIGTDGYSTFRFFNNKFENGEKAENVWNEIKEYFRTFEEWFENPVLYHYIGYLVCVGEKITEIYNLCNGKKKNELKKALREKIKSTIKGVKLDELEYGNVNIRKVLLLLNIQHLLKQNENKTQWYIRFPFDLYVKEKWDIEHIAPQTSSENFEKFDEQKKFIEANIDVFESNDDLKNKAYEFLPLKNKDDKSQEMFDGLHEMICDSCEGEIDDNLKNGIGNLTLLNSDINRSYGNAIFELKRKRIIEEDKNGKFIPICTKNIFLKYVNYKVKNILVWTEDDYDSYTKFIEDTLKDFIAINA